MIINHLDESKELEPPFAYDEIFYNQMTRSYEFMKDGVLVAELKAHLTINNIKRQL